MSKKVIPIFYTIDDDYAAVAYLSIFSLIKNASPDYEYNIYVIHQNLSSANFARFESLSRPGFNVIPYDFPETLDFIPDTDGNRLNGSIFTLSIYFRIFLPDVFPEYDKGIYIDADTIVPGDISELFNIDLGEHLLGGAQDLSVSGQPIFIEYFEKGAGVPYEQYINSGVLLMNMRALRAAGLKQRFLDIFTTYHAETVAPDQDYINTLCLGRIYYLDRAWNAMPAKGLAPLAEPKLIHYNLFFKPWHYPVDYDEYFWRYAEEARIADEFRIILASYDDAARAADARALASMLDASQRIIRDGSGLAPVFAKERRLQ